MTGPGDPNDPREDAWFGSGDDLDWPTNDLDAPGEPEAGDTSFPDYREPGGFEPDTEDTSFPDYREPGGFEPDTEDTSFPEYGQPRGGFEPDAEGTSFRDDRDLAAFDSAPVGAEAGETVEADGAPAAEPTAAEPATDVWDTRRFGDRRRPTTAEQAVPWLVGLVLALAGIVIVLLALIYTEANGGFAASGSPGTAPIPSSSASLPGAPSPSASALASATETPAPTPAPTYGAEEMLYLARPSALAASELFRDDFATAAAPKVVAKSSLDIAHYAVAPDGTVMTAIVNGELIAITPGKPDRTLASDVTAVTFGGDASTVYAVKIVRGGANDDATIYAIRFSSGTTTTLATINFAHPATEQRSQLNDARFFDEGGEDRLYATSDGNVVFWVSRVGQWRIDPVSGTTIEVARQPVLWSPNGTQHIVISSSGLQSTLSLVDSTGNTLSRTQVTGLLSHLRWSPSGTRVVFTLGVNASNGGVRQDLYIWDLGNGKKPTQLTSNGASFGAEWLGVAQFWQP